MFNSSAGLLPCAVNESGDSPRTATAAEAVTAAVVVTAAAAPAAAAAMVAAVAVDAAQGLILPLSAAA